MKRLCMLAFIAVTLVFASYAYAAPDMTKLAKELPVDVLKEVSHIPAKPHFLLGLEPKTDEWEAYLEERKAFQTKDLFYGDNGPGLMDNSSPDYRVPGNTELSEKITIEGKTLTILYTHHHLTADGMYTFRSRTGEKNLAEFSPLYRKYEIQWGVGKFTDSQWHNIQRVMGWAQFEALKNSVHEAIMAGLKKDIRDYTEMNLTSGVIEARAKLLDDPDYAKHLDDAVPGTKGLKVRDILPVPLTRAEDFLPDLIIVSPRGFWGAMTNWGVPGSEKVVFLDLLGLAIQYVSGFPLTAHEFVHANPYLQWQPMALYFDFEMWAALTTDLDDSFMEYLFHPYLSVIRDMVRTSFGYDFQEVRRRVFPEGAMQISDVSEKEFRANAAEVKKIRDELLRFVKDPDAGVITQFYRDPYFWIAVNTKYCDTSAVWRILFSLRYAPAGLFDPEKKGKDGKVIPPAVQTQEWLMKEEESGRITELAKKALAKTGEQTEFGKKLADAKIYDPTGMSVCPVDARFFFLDGKEKKQFADVAERLIRRAKAGDKNAAFMLWKLFGTRGTLPVLAPQMLQGP